MTSLKIDINNLDKSNWESHRFDEIANNISERIDPNNTDLEIYIGLEHIDSSSLHIKRNGTPDDVNGQKLKFYKGDVIFGRRRAYLRKASVTTSEGFCSAHALVLRANSDVIDSSLFPFFLHSDSFMNRAVDISVGSLSPTINWGTLKHQEFLIPPKDHQSKLSDLFRSIDELMIHEEKLSIKLDVFSRVKLKNVLLGRDVSKKKQKIKNIDALPKHWDIVPMSEMFNKMADKNKDLLSDNVLTISAKHGLVDQETYFNKKVSSKDLSNYFFLQRGDFAYNKSYSDGFPAGAIKELENYDVGVVSPLYICMRPTCSDYLASYYKYLFESGFLNQQILSVAKEGARNHGLLNVSAGDFFNLKIPVPSHEEVTDILHAVKVIGTSLSSHQLQLGNVKNLQASLIEKVF